MGALEKARMNIVMIGPFALTPKATSSARALPMAQALTRRGHQVTLLLPPYDNLADAARVESREGVQIQNLPLKRITTLTPLTAALRLATITKKLAPEVVHIFKPVGYAALAGMILYQTSSLPLVTDTDDWEGTGGWNSTNPYSWHWKRFFDLQEKWLPTHSAAVTVASRTLETQIWGMGVTPRRVFYLPNCPRPEMISRSTLEQEKDRVRVRAELGIGDAPMAIYVGHITLGDDLDLALLAMRQVRERVPKARLIIVGEGEGRARLQALAQELALSEAVTFTGWIDHEQIPAYLAAADAAIYPYRDTLINRAKCSIKILEYMAMGKAIVTHRVGQNIEYLEHGRSGFLAEPGNTRQFAEGLVSVLSDRELAKRLGYQARQRIETEFNWAQKSETAEQAYRLARNEPQK
jgi:glycosyltransferase involved in cell wall biosynthesis